MLWIVCLALCCTEIAGQFLNCGFIRSLDCGRYPPSKVCATNGVTYNNRCLFAKVQCQNSNLHLKNDGECSATVSSTTTTATTTTAGISAQFLNCPWVRSLDCTRYPQSLTCSTNDVTFQNVCYLAKATCADNNVRKAHDGACATTTSIKTTTATTATATTTTTTPTTTSTTSPPTTMDSHCLTILNNPCPSTFQPVCGSDGKIYPNMCYVSKAKCRDHSLRIYNNDSCFAKYTMVGRRAVAVTTPTPTVHKHL